MPAGERKLATLLFADLSGYTDMTRRLDPEDVVSVVDPVMRDLQRVAEAHGGTVLMTAGDGVLCAFGVPVVREDDALRAVRAAAEMRSLAAAAQGTSGVHIGIASGEVLISPDQSLRGWGITGLCVAVAARLSDLAVNDEILAEDVCRRLAGPAARWGSERATHLQGMGDDPVQVAQLIDLDGAPSPRARGPLVGRQVEQARLDELLSRVLTEEESSVVSVQGEAGIGKSRLVDAWLERHPEVTAITGRCHSYGAARPLAGLLDAVLDHLRVRGLLNRADLRHLLSPLPEAEAVVSRLLELAEGALLPPAEDVGSVLTHALRSLLVGLTAQSALAVVVDDAHWAGDDLVRFLSDLEKRPVQGRLLVVTTQREGPRWGELADLGPLPEWAVKQLIAAQLPSAPASLVQSLLARTGGNPLYLGESLNLLADGVDAEDLASRLPPSVRALLTARLDALPAEAKEVALVASAGADLASVAALRALIGRRPDAELQLLVRRGVLVEVTGGGYRFGHRLFQEAAYSALTRSRRVELHLGYLDLLGPESPSLRAFHAESAWEHLNAESPDRSAVALRALTELHALGETLFAWQAGSARAVFQRAEAVAKDLPEDVSGVVSAALATYAQVLVDLGELPEALRIAQQAIAAAVDSRSEAVARLAVGHALARIGEMEQARDELEPVMRFADARLRGRALRFLALTWRFESEERFCGLLEEAFLALREAGDEVGQAEVARLLAYLLSMSGSARFQRWFDVAAESVSLDDLRGRALMVRTACFAACAKTDWPGARDLADESLALGRRAGVRDVVVDASLAGISARTYLGDWSGALTLRSDLDAVELPSRGRLALACASALTLMRAGMRTAAVAELDLARSLAAQFGDRERVLERTAFAQVAADAAVWDTAAAAGAAAVALISAVGADLLALPLRLLVCRIKLSGGELPAVELQQVAAAAQVAGATSLESLATVLLDQAEGVMSRGSLPAADHIEARAIWFENAAMHAADDVARGSWQRAHDEWARLGDTIWTQRALKAKHLLPRTPQELAQIPLTPLLEKLPSGDA